MLARDRLAIEEKILEGISRTHTSPSTTCAKCNCKDMIQALIERVTELENKINAPKPVYDQKRKR